MTYKKTQVVVKQTRYGAGKGLYAGEDIKKGAFIVEYTGKKLPNSIADYLGTRYIFDLENGFSIDGSPMSNKARWVNHSCNPNAEYELDEEESRVRVLAKRSIKAGEEITVDYGDEYFNEFIKPKGCKCAACLERTGAAKK